MHSQTSTVRTYKHMSHESTKLSISAACSPFATFVFASTKHMQAHNIHEPLDVHQYTWVPV